jgi:hypothetical protein
MTYISIVFLVLASMVVFFQYAALIEFYIRSRRGDPGGHSVLPIMSLFFSLLAWAYGYETFGLWAFLPAILDPGTWVLVFLPFVLFHIWRNSRNSKGGETDGKT